MGKQIIDFELNEEDIIEESVDRVENIPQQQVFRKVERAYIEKPKVEVIKPDYDSDEYWDNYWNEVDEIMKRDDSYGVPKIVYYTMYSFGFIEIGFGLCYLFFYILYKILEYFFN